MSDRLHAGLMLGVALLGYVGWTLYWTTDLFVNLDDPFWNRYEDTFVAADLLMCTAFLASAVLLLKQSSLAVPFGVAAAGGMVFLVALDVTFNLRNGHYHTLTPVMLFEVGLNLLCFLFGPITIVRLWRRRNDLEHVPRPAPAIREEVANGAGGVGGLRLFAFCARVNLFLTGGFGTLFVAAPQLSLRLLGVVPDAGAVVLIQAYGCSLVFLAVLCWWFRDTVSMVAVRGLSAANCVEDALLAALMGVRTFQGHLNSLGWVLMALFVLEVVVHALVLAATRGASSPRRKPDAVVRSAPLPFLLTRSGQP
jgi:hypothetical protein